MIEGFIVIQRAREEKMIRSITLRLIVGLLNKLLDMDSSACQFFIDTRISCNKAIWKESTIIARHGGDNFYSFNIIGFLNGLFGKNKYGFGYINYELSDKGNIIRFNYNPKLGKK